MKKTNIYFKYKIRIPILSQYLMIQRYMYNILNNPVLAKEKFLLRKNLFWNLKYSLAADSTVQKKCQK